MNDTMKNMLIGLFVAVAIGLFVGMILFIEPQVGDGKQKIIARFSNINGISIGTRVMFAGKPVGEVSEIEAIPDARDQPVDQDGNVYYYQLILRVDSKVRVFNTDEFTVQTSGLLGDKSIAIIPRSPPKHVTPKLVTCKTPIYAQSIDPLESALHDFARLSDKIDKAVEQIIDWVDENGPALSQAVVSFDAAMGQISTAVKTVNDEKVIASVKETSESIGKAATELSSAMIKLDNKNAFDNAGTMIEQLTAASYDIRDIVHSVKCGKGTIGKLFMDDKTYLQVNAILSKADTLMNDINQYGLLFNHNKKWQRLRVKQASMISSLRSPQQFKSYFSSQVDIINTAMGRLSMVIDKASTEKEKKKILSSNEFADDFADLLRQVKSLAETLKLYNQHLQSLEQEVGRKAS